MLRPPRLSHRGRRKIQPSLNSPAVLENSASSAIPGGVTALAASAYEPNNIVRSLSCFTRKKLYVCSRILQNTNIIKTTNNRLVLVWCSHHVSSIMHGTSLLNSVVQQIYFKN